MKYYAGVGSRKTPNAVLELMKDIAKTLEKKGYTLRSGGCTGADSAFADGTETKDIYIPWRTYNNITKYKRNSPEVWTYKIAKSLHPAWDRCSQGAKKLHARNVHQILGDSLDPKPCEFVVCWTPSGRKVGGTATAIKLADKNNIKVYNLAKPKDRKALNERFRLSKQEVEEDEDI